VIWFCVKGMRRGMLPGICGHSKGGGSENKVRGIGSPEDGGAGHRGGVVSVRGCLGWGRGGRVSR